VTSGLIDTSLLTRLANATDPLVLVAQRAILRLIRRGFVLRSTSQVMVEFRNVATRPPAQNGLGMSAAEADAETAIFESSFPILPETPAIYPAWKAIVQAAGVIGKQVHDARLVAVCHVHAVTHLLTFNVRHFARFAAVGPGLVVVDPHTV
jgi:predicted nucleic acid-binding protein